MELVLKKNKATNGWENIGKVTQELIDSGILFELTTVERAVFDLILRYSLGFNNHYTKNISYDFFVEKTGKSKRQIARAIKSLKDKELIVVIRHNKDFIAGGGSYPNQYGINFKNINKSLLKFNDVDYEKVDKQEDTNEDLDDWDIIIGN